MKKKRNPVKWWVVPLLVVCAMAFVAGVTTLVMYLSGALSNEKIEPSDISFSGEVEDGLAWYDASGEDSSGSYGTYYTSSDFSIVISTSTEDVTAKNVTLSLNGGTATSDGYITDGNIKVPQTVKLGTAFTVSLVTANGAYVGGISAITARSENTTVRYKTVYVAVDVAASSFDLQVVETTSTDGVFEVIEGTSFFVDEVFTPTNSKFLYSDSSNPKEVFYSFTGDEYISMTDSETGKFSADATTAGVNATITAYAFTSAYYQEKFLEEYGGSLSREAIARLIESELSKQSSEYAQFIIQDTISVKVIEVTISEMTISENLTFSVTADKKFTITANSSSDGSLGAAIIDTNGDSRASLLSNVGILITGLTADQFTLSGGYLMRVAGDGTISQVTEVTDTSSTYYYLPNTSITPKTAYGNYYWTFCTTSSLGLDSLANLSVSVYANFFYQESGVWKALYSTSTAATTDKMQSASVKISASTNEVSPSWSSSVLEIEITYDKNTGAEIPNTVSLSDLLTLDSAFSSNTYQTIKYFFVLSSDETTRNTEISTIKEIFNVESDAQQYSKDYLGNTVSYYLLEISDDYLTANKVTSGSFSIVAATVRTDANNKIVAGTDTKFQLVNLSTQKSVSVTSALSIANMTASYVALNSETAVYETAADDSGAFYVPFVMYDSSNTKIDQITFVLNVEKKSSNDYNTLVNAISNGSLTLQVLSASTNTAVSTFETTWGSVTETEDMLTCEVSVSIDETAFTEDEDGNALAASERATEGIGYTFRLLFNNESTGEEEKQNLTIYKFAKETTGGEVGTDSTSVIDTSNSSSTLYVYYPTACAISTGYENIAGTDATVTVSGSTTEIYWNSTSAILLSTMNSYFVFDLVDQHGNYILSESAERAASNLFDVEFEEYDPDTSQKVLSSNSIIGLSASGKKISNFSTTDGEEVERTLVLFVIDNNDSTNKVEANELRSSSQQNYSFAINFTIKSEGLSDVKYDSSEQVGLQSLTTADNFGSITVTKYVTKGTKLNIADTNSGSQLFAIEVGDKIFTDYTVRLADNTYSSTNTALSAMMTFTTSASTYTLADLGTTWDGSGIQYISFNSAFGTETTLYLTIEANKTTENSDSLFQIEFNLVLGVGATIGTTFSAYANQSAGTLSGTNLTYGDFLAEDPNNATKNTKVDSVFAGETYDLTDYLTFTSCEYFTIAWDKNMTVYESTGTITQVSESTKISIASVSAAQEYTFYVYLNGIESTYNIYAKVTLYVVPNILVKETNTTYRLDSTTNSVGLQFYEATEYIKYLVDLNSTGTATMPSVLSSSDLTGIEFEKTGTDYLSIVNTDGVFSFGSLTITESAIEMALGGSLSQVFALNVEAVRLTSAGKVVSASDTDNKCLITIEISLGTVSETLQTIFGDSIQIVEYDGTRILLESAGSISVSNSSIYSVTASSGSISVSQTAITANSVNKLATGTATITATFGSGFQITFDVDILISSTGSKLVQYTSSSSANTFDGVDFDDLTSINQSSDNAVAALEEGNVYEELSAGATYALVHGYNSADYSTATWGLFYRNATSVSLECVSAYGVLESDGTTQTIDANGLFVIGDLTDYVISVKVNNLATTYSCVYAVFKLSVTVNYTDVTTYYYRVRITPNFAVGKVTYPISTSAEYLDSLSDYYTSGTYTIALNSEISQVVLSESSNQTETISRFTAPTGSADTTLSGYSISSVFITVDSETIDITSAYSTYVSISIEDGVLKITPTSAYSTATFTIVVVATYQIGQFDCFGGDLSYTFVVRGSSSHTQSLETESYSTLTSQINEIEVTAGQAEEKIKVTLKRDFGSGSYEEVPVSKVLLSGDSAFFGWLSFSGSTLTITAPPTVSSNSTVTVSFASSELVVCKLSITFTSFYSYEINSTFSGGTAYSIHNAASTSTSLFTALSSTGTAASSVSLELADSTATTDQFGGTVALSDLFIFTSVDGDLASSKLEFAHLLQDTTFTFKCTINPNNNEYTFEFSIVVSASFVNSTGYFTFVANGLSDDDGYDTGTSGLYGGLTYTFTISNIQAQNQTTYSLSDSGKTTFTFADGAEKSSITPAYVSKNNTEVTTTVTLWARFNGKEIFSFDVAVTYLTLVSVSVEANTPTTINSSGESAQTAAEYVQVTLSGDTYKSATYAAFFSGLAPYASSARIFASNVYDSTKDTNLLSEFASSGEVSLSISSATNAQVAISYGGYTDTLSSGKELSANIAKSLDQATVYFMLEDSSTKSGSVTFSITVKGVNVSFTVILTTSEIVSIQFNSPTSQTGSGVETIYAETLSTYSSYAIFEQGRLLTFTSNITLSDTVFVFSNGSGTEEPVKISATSGQETIVDLGKSYSGWTLKSVGGVEDYSSMFTIAPTLTSRAVVKYADGTTITSTESQFTYSASVLVDGTAKSLEDQQLSKFDFTYNSSLIDSDETVALSITYSGEVSATGAYSVVLTTNIKMTDNAVMSDDAVSLPAYYDKLSAGDSIELFGSSNSLAAAMGITTKSSATTYTNDLISSNNATVYLEVYGFKDMQVQSTSEGGDEWQNYAYNIHNFLLGNTIDGISYSTGIIPRYGMVLNNTGDNETEHASNYVDLTGSTTEAGNIGYTINANGASNDGNFVLLRLTYTVSLGGYSVDSIFNILLRIHPSVTATYKTSINDKTTENSFASVTENSVTTASNVSDPYTISTSAASSAYTFALFEDTVGTNTYTDETKVISASGFTATRIVNATNTSDGLTYNETAGTTNWAGTVSGGVWTIDGSVPSSGDSSSTFTSVSVSTDLFFGQKYFVINLVDAFGYVIDFYFTLEASDNPTIQDGTITLTEGGNMLFWSDATTYTPQTTTIDGTTYYTFAEQSFSNANENNRYLILDSARKTVVSVASGVGYYDDGSTNSVTTAYYEDANGNKKSIALSSVTVQMEIATTNFTTSAEDYDYVDLTSCAVTYDGYTLYGDDELSYKLYLSSGTATIYVSTSSSNESIEVYISTGTSVSDATRLSVSYTAGKNTGIDWGSIEGSAIEVSGLQVYAFSSSSSVDLSSVSNLTSIAQHIYVTQVEFYYGGEKIETASYSDSGSDQPMLSLNESYYYVDSDNEIATGKLSETNFKVPTFNANYYGTGTTIGSTTNDSEKLTMYVTLMYKNGTNIQYTVVKSNVIVQRSSVSLFSQTTLGDGDAPIVTAGDVEVYNDTLEVYNDTLEIDLQENETVSLAISLNPFVEENGTYYSYIQTTDETRQSSKTYYVYDSTFEVSQETTFTDGTTYYELVEATFHEISNDEEYATTEYLSLSDLLNDELSARLLNLNSSDSFYVIATSSITVDEVTTEKDPSIRYGGSAVTSGNENLVLKYDYNGTSDIDVDSALTIEVPSVNALSDNSMQRELFFVYELNGQYYRNSTTFTITPKYIEASASGDITIEEFYKVTNGTSTFYIAPLSSWASNITLTTSLGATGSITEARQFTFEIGQSSSGSSSGSAYIDENGTIRTTAVQLSTNRIYVNLYMKVSGIDGNFEEENTSISLGTFTIYLSDSAVQEDDSENTLGNGTYVLTNDNMSSVVTVPYGYSLYRCSTGSFGLDVSNETLQSASSWGNMLTAEVGETLDFSEILASGTGWSNWTNVAYHIVSENGTAVSAIELSTHTFNTVGSRMVEVLVVGYDSDGKYSSCLVSVDVVVYDTSATTETVAYVVEKGATDFNPIASGETWFLLNEDGTAKAVTGFDVSSVGYSSTSYYVVSSSGNRIVTLNLFVYDSDSDTSTAYESVAVSTNQVFSLSNLLSATFFTYDYDADTGKYTNLEECTTDTISASGTRNYLVVYEDSDGSTVVQFLEVYYKTSSSTSATTSNTFGALIQVGVDESGDTKTFTLAKEDIISQVCTSLSLSQGDFTLVESFENGEEAYLSSGTNFLIIQTMDENGVLSLVDDIETTSTTLKQTFYVTYDINGKTTSLIIQINFYTYETSAEISAYVANTTDYSLSNLTMEVLEEFVGEGTYYLTFYSLSGSACNATTTVDLQLTSEGSYRVGIQDDSDGTVSYHLVTINFNIYYDKTITLSASGLEADLDSAFGSWYSIYSNSNFSTTANVSAIDVTSSTKYYVKMTSYVEASGVDSTNYGQYYVKSGDDYVQAAAYVATEIYHSKVLSYYCIKFGYSTLSVSVSLESGASFTIAKEMAKIYTSGDSKKYVFASYSNATLSVSIAVDSDLSDSGSYFVVVSTYTVTNSVSSSNYAQYYVVNEDDQFVLASEFNSSATYYSLSAALYYVTFTVTAS